MSNLEKVCSIITEECIRKNIKPNHIKVACEHARQRYQVSGNFVQSIFSGIAVAEDLQYKSSFFNSSS